MQLQSRQCCAAALSAARCLLTEGDLVQDEMEPSGPQGYVQAPPLAAVATAERQLLLGGFNRLISTLNSTMLASHAIVSSIISGKLPRPSLCFCIFNATGRLLVYWMSAVRTSVAGVA
jgi:hypothetical protein